MSLLDPPHQEEKTFYGLHSPTKLFGCANGRFLEKLIGYRHMKNLDNADQDSFSPYNSLVGAGVFDRHGNRANISSLYQKDGATIAVLAMEDGRSIDADLSEFERHEDSFFTPASLSRKKNDPSLAQSTLHEEMNIPVAKEEINIDKRSVDTGAGIRVTKHVLDHDEIVNVPHVTETLSVRHIEAGQIVAEDSLPQTRQEGDTYIIPVFEEVYVLEKRIRLKEEIHITRERKETKEDQKINLRSEQVSIERFDDSAARD